MAFLLWIEILSPGCLGECYILTECVQTVCICTVIFRSGHKDPMWMLIKNALPEWNPNYEDGIRHSLVFLILMLVC